MGLKIATGASKTVTFSYGVLYYTNKTELWVRAKPTPLIFRSAKTSETADHLRELGGLAGTNSWDSVVTQNCLLQIFLHVANIFLQFCRDL